MKKSKLIGKEAKITNEDSWWFEQYGIIKAFDGDCYHIAMTGDDDCVCTFKRNEFKVRTESLKKAKAKYKEKVDLLRVELYPTDADIKNRIEERLTAGEKKATYIKRLIREDIKKVNNNG